MAGGGLSASGSATVKGPGVLLYNTGPSCGPISFSWSAQVTFTPYPGSTEPATRFGCRDTQTGAPLKLG